MSYLGGLRQQVETSETLGLAEQSTLLVEIKRSMRASDTARDGRTLLASLRKRRDLLAAIADEIDETLASIPEGPLAKLRLKPTRRTGDTLKRSVESLDWTVTTGNRDSMAIFSRVVALLFGPRASLADGAMNRAPAVLSADPYDALLVLAPATRVRVDCVLRNAMSGFLPLFARKLDSFVKISSYGRYLGRQPPISVRQSSNERILR